MTNHTQDKTNIYDCEKCGETVRPYMGEIHTCHTQGEKGWEEEFENYRKSSDPSIGISDAQAHWVKDYIRNLLQTHTEQKVREEAVSWYLKVKEMTKTIRENDFAKGIKIAKDLDDRMKELQTLTPNDK